jgi:hemerythrin-like domain-containing protein
MKSTEILMDEHLIIERVLSALQGAAEHVSRGEAMHPVFFVNAAIFIKDFADGYHHRKEEDILFVAMQKAGIPVQGGPIGVMLNEHEQGRVFTRAMMNAAQMWETGDLSARAVVVQNALGYVALLRQHINKENNILFPMADRIIPSDRQEKIVADFEHIDLYENGDDIHKKYLEIAEQLEKESQEQL